MGPGDWAKVGASAERVATKNAVKIRLRRDMRFPPRLPCWPLLIFRPLNRRGAGSCRLKYTPWFGEWQKKLGRRMTNVQGPMTRWGVARMGLGGGSGEVGQWGEREGSLGLFG